METKIKKGMKVICRYFSDKIAQIDYIYPDGLRVDLKYKDSKGRYGAFISDLEFVTTNK